MFSNKLFQSALILGRSSLWILSLFFLKTSLAAEMQLASFDSLYSSSELLSIATGKPQTVLQAPAVTSLITAADIAEMGALQLADVLETIPGMHISRSYVANLPIMAMRGVQSYPSTEVLFLLNGIPTTNLYSGDQSYSWSDLPVRSIARIEVIRGPGSSVYGADAFAGVVNVITKDTDDIEKGEVGLGYGQFNSRQVWLQKSLERGDWKMAISLEGFQTDGHEGIVHEDFQTILDLGLGTSLSNAPGSSNNQVKQLDTWLDLQFRRWQVRLGLLSRRDMGDGAGIGGALAPESILQGERRIVDISYRNENIFSATDLLVKAGYFESDNSGKLVLLPKGATIAPGIAFDNGMIGQPFENERVFNLEASLLVRKFAGHELHLAGGFRSGDMYQTGERKNFNNFYLPLPEVVDVEDYPQYAYMQPHVREDLYAYVQDIWNFAPDWEATLGIRHDSYSDFGETTNPRVALVWHTAQDLSLKVLYGSAFRAPSFVEQYAANNPVVLGSADIKPEKVTTGEFVINYFPTENAFLALNFFQFVIEDKIVQTDEAVFLNQGEQLGQGAELEYEFRFADTLRLTGNFAGQENKNDQSGDYVGNSPRWQGYSRLSWHPTASWEGAVSMKYVSGRFRASDDPRPNPEDYASFNLTVSRYFGSKDYFIRLIARNMTDADRRDPNLAKKSKNLPYIDNDIPLAGRQLFVQGGMQF